MGKTAAYIRRKDCKHRHLYRIASRNLPLGVWDERTKGFVGIRLKFGSRYLFEEYHWDEPQFATAKPLELLEPLPDGIELNEDGANTALFEWLKAAEERHCPGQVRKDRWS